MKEKIKNKNDIPGDFLILGLLIFFSIWQIKDILSLPVSYFSSPEIPGYLFPSVVVWVITIWFGRRLYKKLKK